VSAYECGLKIRQKPTEFEKEKLSRRIEQAIQSNQITLADAMMIENLENLKYAEVLLGYRIKKNQEETQQRAMEAQQMNGQIQQQSAMAAEQAKQQTLQMEAQIKMQVIQMEKQLESQLLAQKQQGEALMEQGRIEGKINVSKIESDSREFVQQIKNQKMSELKK
jgi:hypothetical protein